MNWPVRIFALCEAGVFAVCLAGCVDGIRLPAEDAAKDRVAGSVGTHEAVFDLGVGAQTVSKACQLEMAEPATVVAVRRGCGCTSVGLVEGDRVEENGRFVATIDLSNKAPGPGSQSAVIEFDNGAKYHLVFRYEHKPPAFCQPPYALFPGAGSEATLDFVFPADAHVALVDSKMPDGLRVIEAKAGPLTAEPGAFTTLKVRLGIDPLAHKRGTLVFRFSAEDRPVFRIPYLYVVNDAESHAVSR